MVQQQLEMIEAKADQSEAVTENTIEALAQNDPAIEDATDPILRTSLIADQLLVFGNLGRAVKDGIASYGRGALACKIGANRHLISVESGR